MIMVLNAEMPKLVSAESNVMTCASCGTWYERYPAFMDGDSKGDQCDRCGCTSFKVREGRPYGPKSKDWKWILEAFEKTWKYFDPEEAELVITDPPLQFPPDDDDDPGFDPRYEYGPNY